MRSDKKYGFIGVIVAILSIFIIWIVGFGQVSERVVEAKEEKDTMFDYVQLINSVAWNIDAKYVEEVDLKELVYSGIRGMLDILDPFSDMKDKEAYEQLMEVTHGKYEGLGMAIALRNEIVTVISPIEGTPAYRKGIRAGDKIIEIDGQSTSGMSTEDAAKFMRGSAGTKVVLKIKREGLLEPLEYELERAVIQLKNVPYYGVVEDNIGYIRLSRFSEETSKELQDALKSLKNKNLQGLILDLRSNGGGLLSQAVETANLFLEKEQLIVYTQGRKKERIREYHSQGNALYNQGPLAVLVDEGTASASEIVAGAIQDWDRGVIIGQTTFGKGLVQQVFEMPKDVYLKLTIAKYYVPSGRCIQRPERAKKHPTLDENTEEDSLEKETFYTNGGRKVYGGGGIVPDLTCEQEEFEPIEINLELKQVFFDFAVEYISQNKDIKRNFEVTDEILEEFNEFLKGKDFTYKTYVEMQLDTLEKTIKSQEKSELYSNHIEAIKSTIEQEKKLDFDKSLDYIKHAIKRDILRNKFGEAAVYEESLTKTDHCVRKAIEILTSKNKYTSLLEAG
ncbi:MAG: S41 family peptidase [Candidatus Zixiibacteriota bacterium]